MRLKKVLNTTLAVASVVTALGSASVAQAGLGVPQKHPDGIIVPGTQNGSGVAGSRLQIIGVLKTQPGIIAVLKTQPGIIAVLKRQHVAAAS